MKSKLIGTLDFSEKDFAESFSADIAILLKLSQEHIVALYEILPQLITAKTTKEKKSLYNKFEGICGISHSSFNRVVRQLNLYCNAFASDDFKEEEPSTWASDLVDIDVIKKEDEEKLNNFLLGLKSVFDSKISSLHTKNVYQSGIVPALSGFGTTVEMRAVLKKEYQANENIEEYLPEIVDIVPVITAKLNFDSGHIRNIIFQAAPDSIKLLINELESALKVSSAMEKALVMPVAKSV